MATQRRTSIPNFSAIKRETLGPQTKNSRYWLNILMSEENPNIGSSGDSTFQVDNSTSATTMFSTTSTNPSRPRTIRAGYDFEEEKLIVVFRDGTWYEYRGVPAEMWYDFQMAPSKGAYLRESGLDTWMDKGPADVGSMPKAQRAQMANLQDFATYMYSDNKE
jgi:hypothetical protein